MGLFRRGENDTSAVAGSHHAEDEGAVAAALLSGSGKMFSTLQLSISLADLHNKDKTSLSDPFVVVYVSNPPDSPGWDEIGRTEIVANSLSPSFVKLISLQFHFEQAQKVRVEIYDADTSFKSADASKMDIKKQDFQGYAEMMVAELVGAVHQTLTCDIIKGSPPTADRGTVSLRVQEAANTNAMVTMEMSIRKLDDVETFSKSDPFLVFSRVQEFGPPIRCYKTEVHMNNLNPDFRQINIPLAVLAQGNLQSPLLIECFDYKKKGDHQLIASLSASVTDLQEHCNSKQPLTLVNAKKAAKKGTKYKGSGDLLITTLEVVDRPSFFDYLVSGCELNFAVAIDYTASNGNPTTPGTLHYHSGQDLNEYGQAISGLGNILEYYDHTKQYPVHGFGGLPRGERTANHCFAVNRNEAHPEVQGVQGILNTYYNSIQSNDVMLSGPTLFAPVINNVAAIAASTKGMDPQRQRYFVLLIITDGLISDMANTIDAIVACSELPLSIVIVGVGQEDFGPMRRLDGDDSKLVNSQGKQATRDLVQFVPMRSFKGHPDALAKEVLAELPTQLVQYMSMMGIKPIAPQHAPSQPRAQGAAGGGGQQAMVQDGRKHSAASAAAAGSSVPPPPSCDQAQGGGALPPPYTG